MRSEAWRQIQRRSDGVTGPTLTSTTEAFNQVACYLPGAKPVPQQTTSLPVSGSTKGSSPPYYLYATRPTFNAISGARVWMIYRAVDLGSYGVFSLCWMKYVLLCVVRVREKESPSPPTGPQVQSEAPLHRIKQNIPGAWRHGSLTTRGRTQPTPFVPTQTHTNSNMFHALLQRQ